MSKRSIGATSFASILPVSFTYNYTRLFQGELISRIREIIHKARQKEYAYLKITNAQISTLQILHDLGGVAKASEISRWKFRNRNSIHNILIRMEKEGLIKKIKNPKKQYYSKVMLTEKGLKLYHQTIERKILNKIMSHFSNEQIDQMISSLELIKVKATEETNQYDELPLRPPVLDDKYVKIYRENK